MSEQQRGDEAIVLDAGLWQQVQQCYAEAGFASPAAFVHHCVTKELKLQQERAEKVLAERLRNLGYLE